MYYLSMTDAVSAVIKALCQFLTSLALTPPRYFPNIPFFFCSVFVCFFEQRDNAVHLVGSFRADSIMICLISTLRLIGTFTLTVPLTSLLFPQEFCVAVCASWLCHQQSQQSANCTTVPPRRVSATAPVEIEEGGPKWEKTPPAALWHFVSIVSRDFEKSCRIQNMCVRTQRKNFLNKGATRNWCLPSSFPVQRH